MVTYKEIRENEEIREYIRKGNANLGVLGYTDHSVAHCAIVAEEAGKILEMFGYSEHEIELAKIAGFMHDIGNCVNRSRHAEYGGLLANEILKGMDISLQDRVTVISAIGHHDESTGRAMDAVSAALIIADKTDVRRNRVREKEKATFDIHDRVNYAVTESKLSMNAEEKTITLNLEVDEKICTMYEYFEIFLGRMMMCRSAAEMLGAGFRLRVNGSKVL
ncbi:MAG: HD domain-containing protein [bacterium]|nr:HD domain-containing protein [bacterium]